MRTRLLVGSAFFLLPFFACTQHMNKEKVEVIHQKSLTLDSHTDTPLQFTRSIFNMGEKHDVQETRSRLDLIRMKEGGLDAVFLAAFIGQDVRNQEGNEKAKRRVNEIVDSIYAQADLNKHIAGIALTPEDAYQLEKENKRALYIGIENGYALGKDISLVKHFYNRGVRYITLCHTKNNDICDSSTDSLENNGLSDFGKDVVKEMNALGIMIDISHASDKTFYDVLDVTKTPIIASHSNTRTLCDHPRNFSDDMLKKLAENNGVIQVCFVTDYLKKTAQNPERDEAFKNLRIKYNYFKDLTDNQLDSARREWYAIDKKYPQKLATVNDLVNHIDHIVKVAGINHVGIGTDFDGGGGLEDCLDVSQMQNITEELLRRGYEDEDIIKIWGGNFMRVFQDVVDFAKENN